VRIAALAFQEMALDGFDVRQIAHGSVAGV
jgi:hypothetical protein